jgi:hypothetical protein
MDATHFPDNSASRVQTLKDTMCSRDRSFVDKTRASGATVIFVVSTRLVSGEDVLSVDLKLYCFQTFDLSGGILMVSLGESLKSKQGLKRYWPSAAKTFALETGIYLSTVYDTGLMTCNLRAWSSFVKLRINFFGRNFSSVRRSSTFFSTRAAS